MLKVAVVGTGDWGENLVRNLEAIDQCRLEVLCDTSLEALAKVGRKYPHVSTETDFQRVIKRPEIAALVISTPADTHFELARAALLAGKHVFVEKPLCFEPVQAVELNRLSRLNSRVLMVGHLLEYHPGVDWLKTHLGNLGRIRTVHSQRSNPEQGPADEDVWWGLAPHDISMLLYLLDNEPETVAARCGGGHRSGARSTVLATLRFADGTVAQIHVSRQVSGKVRKFSINGERMEVVFDDVAPSEKIRVIERESPIEAEAPESRKPDPIRVAKVSNPAIATTEPLRIECEHFVTCCLHGKVPRTDGVDGLRVVRVLAAAERSMKAGGMAVSLKKEENRPLRMISCPVSPLSRQ